MRWFVLQIVSSKIITMKRGVFKIRKHAFFNIWKRGEQKNCARNFRFVSTLFLIFEKEMSKKLRQKFSDS